MPAGRPIVDRQLPRADQSRVLVGIGRGDAARPRRTDWPARRAARAAALMAATAPATGVAARWTQDKRFDRGQPDRHDARANPHGTEPSVDEQPVAARRRLGTAREARNRVAVSASACCSKASTHSGAIGTGGFPDAEAYRVRAGTSTRRISRNALGSVTGRKRQAAGLGRAADDGERTCCGSSTALSRSLVLNARTAAELTAALDAASVKHVEGILTFRNPPVITHLKLVTALCPKAEDFYRTHHFPADLPAFKRRATGRSRRGADA